MARPGLPITAVALVLVLVLLRLLGVVCVSHLFCLFLLRCSFVLFPVCSLVFDYSFVSFCVDALPVFPADFFRLVVVLLGSRSAPS